MPELYKQRQSIVEHPYGTIKRAWGFDYIITKKGIRRASADAGLMFIAYNLKRLINIIGKDGLAKYFRKLALLFVKKKASFTHLIFQIRPSFLKPCFNPCFIIDRLELLSIELYLKTNSSS